MDPGRVSGANDTARPCRRAVRWTISRVSTYWSAAATGRRGASEISSWPGPYSGCRVSTPTPAVASASSRSLLNSSSSSQGRRP